MQKKDTPARQRKASRKPSTKKDTSKLHPAKGNADERFDVTDGDKATARTICALYNSKHTPELFKSMIFQTFMAYLNLFEIPAGKNFTRFWRSWWERIIARSRVSGFVVTSMRFSWQPDAAEEAELDAQDALDNEADVLFRMISDPTIAQDTRDDFGKLINDLVNDCSAQSTDQIEIFRAAWPFIRERVKSDEARKGAQQ
jgi:hypothetical protein